ncbi:MAG TPA: hypothetical protein VGK29_08190 [Paludibaculum sp.]|jgi:hypothetical protein
MILLLLWFTLTAAPLMPDRLPPLKGEFLSGRLALLPDAASGRVALLALGFTYDSRFAVEAWVKRFRADYGENPQTTFYEIPMIGGMAQLGKWFIDGGMRRGTPKADHEHVITVYGNTRPWKERVGFQAPDVAYLLLLDKDGSVRWRHSGPFTEAEYQRMSAAVKPLLSTSAQ